LRPRPICAYDRDDLLQELAMRTKRRVLRLVLAISISLVASSCLLTRHTDRGFLGIHAGPVYKNRIYTGLFLLPLAFAVDLATTPIQLIMLVAAGDDFLAAEDEKITPAPQAQGHQVSRRLESDPAFARLTPQQQTKLKEFVARRGGKVPPAFGLTRDGEWVEVPVSDLERRDLIVRSARSR
jgi:hypothetical protein